MNKAELIEQIAEETQFSKQTAEQCLNATLKIIEDAMIAGDRVQLMNFGAFEAKSRAQRKGRNPQSGEAIMIKERRSPVFTAGKALKDAVM